MAISSFAAQGADQIYKSGPESLASEAFAIVAGPVSGYAVQILSNSQGNAPVPLTWSVSGRIDPTRSLKGQPVAREMAFVRQERSPLLPTDANVPDWQLEYDNLAADDQAVLFLTGDPGRPTIEVLPSGRGARDLAGLLSEIILIQAIPNAVEQTDAWLRYLATARSDQGRKAGLRSLLSLNAPWPKLAPTVQYLIAGAGLGPQMRGYVFGIVTFAVMEGKFEAHQADAIEFLGRHFVAETDPRVVLGHVLHLKMLLNFTSDEAMAETRGPLAARIADALRRHASRGPLPAEIAEQYNQIRAAHPGLL